MFGLTKERVKIYWQILYKGVMETWSSNETLQSPINNLTVNLKYAAFLLSHKQHYIHDSVHYNPKKKKKMDYIR